MIGVVIQNIQVAVPGRVPSLTGMDMEGLHSAPTNSLLAMMWPSAWQKINAKSQK